MKAPSRSFHLSSHMLRRGWVTFAKCVCGDGGGDGDGHLQNSGILTFSIMAN